MKNRTREICTSGTVRDEGGNILIYSANDREDQGNVGIIRSPIRASILPDYIRVRLNYRAAQSWVLDGVRSLAILLVVLFHFVG